MQALRPVIASNGVYQLQMTSIGSHSTSGRKREGKKKRTRRDNKDPELKLTCTAHALFPALLFNHCQGLGSIFPEIRTEFDDHSLFHSFVHHEIGIHHTSGIIKYCKIPKSPPSCVKLCTLAHQTCQCHCSLLHNVTKITVQVAASFPNIWIIPHIGRWSY